MVNCTRCCAPALEVTAISPIVGPNGTCTAHRICHGCMLQLSKVWSPEPELERTDPWGIRAPNLESGSV